MTITVKATRLIELVKALLVEAGVPQDHADETASALVAADLDGVASHGVMLLPMYLERLKSGSVVAGVRGELLSQELGSILLDGENGLGQVTAAHAVERAIEAAKLNGYAAVSVRNGFHFGAAGYWAERLAQNGLVGIVMSNTRPLMPPPGGAEARVGNNPIAVAMPLPNREALVLDFALSEAAMGKIRNAAAAGNPIPEGWATDNTGKPTTDPNAAISGMLLPTGGPKGFGLAVMVELLTGGLSGGGVADAVRPLFGDATIPYNCSHFFLAIDLARFGPIENFAAIVANFADRIRQTPPRAGRSAVMAPGDPALISRENAAGTCKLADATWEGLSKVAQSHGIDVAQYLN